MNSLTASSQGPGELTVRFTDISSSPTGKIIKREWDFGDGTRLASSNEDSAEAPEHTYVGHEGDTFAVSMTVQDEKGIDTVTRPAFVSLELPFTSTPAVTPTPIPTPTTTQVSSLTVSPATAGKSLRLQPAIVTSLDKDGEPVPDVEIIATASGKDVMVSPRSAVTGPEGQAEFMFKFGRRSKGGKITFSADGLTATITQE